MMRAWLMLDTTQKYTWLTNIDGKPCSSNFLIALKHAISK